MIIWLNGTFGSGKTSTTAAVLQALLPSSRVFDPETVGYMLAPNLVDRPVSDFQHWPPWRPLVVATATELARFTGQDLIGPADDPGPRLPGADIRRPARRWASRLPCRA
jgi:hypothetical protein